MRWTPGSLVIACSGLAACVADPSTEPSLAEPAVTEAVTATGGACGFDLERARNVCVVTTATTPARRLQIGDAIPIACGPEHLLGRRRMCPDSAGSRDGVHRCPGMDDASARIEREAIAHNNGTTVSRPSRFVSSTRRPTRLNPFIRG
jgi:hypothetical protein